MFLGLFVGTHTVIKWLMNQYTRSTNLTRKSERVIEIEKNFILQKSSL